MLNVCNRVFFKFNLFVKRSTFCVTGVSYNTSSYDTIFALSSGFGKCGVSVVRVSGPRTSDIANNIAGLKSLPEPRKALLRRFKDPQTKKVLDHGLFLYFAGPKSFTGEDCCELQVHGGSAVISSILSALSKIPGCRPAEPGEFTKRAFYAGKFDLTEVEGLADLINAETEAQRSQALFQMEGALNKQYTTWRTMLLRSLAKVEAYIDFSEEENIEDNVLRDVGVTLSELKCLIEKHLNDGRKGERTRNGVKTVIVGEPNVGKSSLLNALCKQQAAIVSHIPGTTRDIVKVSLDICGYPVTLLDTAGLRTVTHDVIEEEGIVRARKSAEDAELILVVLDADQYNTFKCNHPRDSDFESFLLNYIDKLELKNMIDSCDNIKHDIPFVCSKNTVFEESTFEGDNKRCIFIFNKIDMIDKDFIEVQKISEKYGNIVCISCKTEKGFDELLSTLSFSLKCLCGSSTRENPNLSQARHRYHLMACVSAIDRYLSEPELSQIDINAEHIRKASTELGKITGCISVEDVLDVVFKQFCIGK